MIALAPHDLDFSDSFREGDDTARWRSAAGHSPSSGASGSGSSVLEVPAGGLALVPKNVPYEVRNAGAEPLRFVASTPSPTSHVRAQHRRR